MEKTNNNKLIFIFRANEKLLDKIGEVKEFISSNKASFVFNEKEINKYYSLKDNDKAKEYKALIELKNKEFERKLKEEIGNINKETEDKFVSMLINSYAKEEDMYYQLLNISNKERMSASCLFKSEANLELLEKNIHTLLGLKQEIVKKFNVEEQEKER